MKIAEGLGVIDEAGIREFDALCMAPPQELTPEEIRYIRENVHLSQPVFVRCLNISKDLLSDWEMGLKKPAGPALRLLAIVKHKGLAAISG